MKNSFLLIIITFLLQSCGIQMSEDYLSNISKKFKYSDLLLIIPADSSGFDVDVCMSNTELYKDVFSTQKNSEYHDFSKFIQSIYTKRSLEYREIENLPHKIINSKATVFNHYKEKGFNSLIGNYLKKEGNNFSSVYLLDEDDKYGLIKIMFENNFYISWNDYRACFIFTKEIESNDKP